MTTTIPRRPVAGVRRDPALALWTVAGICWAATFALTLTGGAGPVETTVEAASRALPP